jgi:hypothetical protein
MLSQARRFVEALFAVLWACRVSIVALLLPALVLIYAPQARDLFSYFAGHLVGGSAEPDISGGRIWTLVYWVVFTGFVLAFWCYPVHFSARVLLYDPRWLFRRGRNPSDAELRRVSGGSVGAAIFSAAIANSADGQHPCAKEPAQLWFRAGAPANWRNCLQAIVAEDYLSEPMVRLAFHDNLNFLARIIPWPDRAAVLERSWIASFEKWVKQANRPNFRGLDQPLTRFGPNAEPRGWQPLLVLNGTSVTTGRRILTSHLAAVGIPPSPVASAKPERMFMDAYDLFEILSGEAACTDGACEPRTDLAKDVTLASAAMNSARFPILSSPGTLRRHGAPNGEIVDRIVDGGYFENDGVTTTIDLVHALRRAGLRPAVIRVANDPLPYPRSTRPRSEFRQYPWRHDGPALPDAEDRTWFLFLRGPLGGLFATRHARASYALRDLEEAVYDLSDVAEILVYGEPLSGFAEVQQREACIHVDPVTPATKMKHVSMSWWLSQPVQEYLDAQLKLSKNCSALDRVREWLRP